MTLPTGIPDPQGPDWEMLTVVPPEGRDQTRWLSIDREHVLPRRECR